MASDSELRLRHRRGGLGRGDAGGAADRGRRHARAAAGGGAGLPLGRRAGRDAQRQPARHHSTRSSSPATSGRTCWRGAPARRSRASTSAAAGLGGSSAINWQVAHPRHAGGLRPLGRAGLHGWSGEELLPAMNRLENDLDFGDAPYHGRSGPITIYRAPLSRLGHGRPGAASRRRSTSATPGAPTSTRPVRPASRPADQPQPDSRRVSTNDAYLEPARARPNLTILGDAHVDRVLFDGTRATGVRAHARRTASSTSPGARSSSRPARSSPRRSCSAPASARPRTCARWASRCCATCRSARTWSTTPSSGWR